MRLLLYSHDGVGFGHVRRHLAISAALADQAPNAQILLVTSVDEVSSLGLPPNVDTLKIPGLRKVANNQYSSRRLGLSTSEIRALRSDILLSTVRSFRPAVVLVDKHPFGAGGEFRSALQAARAYGGRLVLGLRDILDEKAAVLQEWESGGVQQSIADNYDAVLVYGTPSVFDLPAEYEFSPTLRERTHYCGYVVNQSACAWHPKYCPSVIEPGGRPVVLATAGGGEDGFTMLKTFITAAAGARWKGVAVSGSMLNQEQFKALQRLAEHNQVLLHSFLPCLTNLFREVNALVCMGGYNTLVEAISEGVPITCVPRAEPRAEQLVRAHKFEELGLVDTIHPDDLTVPRLRRHISKMLKLSRSDLVDRAEKTLPFNGAQTAATFLLDLLRTVRRSREGNLVPALC